MKERVAAHSKRSLAPEINEAVDGDRSDFDREEREVLSGNRADCRGVTGFEKKEKVTCKVVHRCVEIERNDQWGEC